MAAVRLIASDEFGPPSPPGRPLPGRRIISAGAAAVIAIEVVAGFGGTNFAPIGYAVLIVLLVSYLALAFRRGDVAAASAAVLVVPLCLRLASLTLEDGPVSAERHYALIGGTAVAALACLVVAFPEFRLRLELSAWRPGQAVVALSGLPIGLACALAFHRGSLVFEHGHWRSRPVLLALAVGAAVTEELLFRGFLQTALGRLVGSLAPAVGTAALLLAYLGVRPVGFVVTTLALGLCSAIVVERSGRLEGVVVARALINSGLFVFWPSILHLH